MSTFLRVTLPSTNEAVYEVQPQYLNDRPGTTLAERVRMHGTHIAVRMSGEWYTHSGAGGSLKRVTDPKVWAALQSVPEA